MVAGPISHGSPRQRQPPDPRPRFTQSVCGVIAPIPGSSPRVEFFHSLLGLALLHEVHDGTHHQLVPARCLQIAALTYTRVHLRRLGGPIIIERYMALADDPEDLFSPSTGGRHTSIMCHARKDIATARD